MACACDSGEIFVSLKHYFVGPCNLQHENAARAGFHQSAGSKVTIAYHGLARIVPHKVEISNSDTQEFISHTNKGYLTHCQNYDSEKRR